MFDAREKGALNKKLNEPCSVSPLSFSDTCGLRKEAAFRERCVSNVLLRGCGGSGLAQHFDRAAPRYRKRPVRLAGLADQGCRFVFAGCVAVHARTSAAARERKGTEERAASRRVFLSSSIVDFVWQTSEATSGEFVCVLERPSFKR